MNIDQQELTDSQISRKKLGQKDPKQKKQINTKKDDKVKKEPKVKKSKKQNQEKEPKKKKTKEQNTLKQKKLNQKSDSEVTSNSDSDFGIFNKSQSLDEQETNDTLSDNKSNKSNQSSSTKNTKQNKKNNKKQLGTIKEVKGDFNDYDDDNDDQYSNDQLTNNNDDTESNQNSNEIDKKTKKNQKQQDKKEKQDKQAPKGKKGKINEEDRVKVFEYMKNQNRPHSSINIELNMHKTVKRKDIEQILDDFSKEGKIQIKEFGKAKIYLVDQSIMPQISQEEIKSMDEELVEKRQLASQLQEQCKDLSNNIAKYNKCLSNDQILSEIEKLQILLEEQEKKLEYYNSDQYEKLDDQTMKNCEEQTQKMEKQYKKYKRICKDAVGQISEFLDKKITETNQILGINYDDEP